MSDLMQQLLSSSSWPELILLGLTKIRLRELGEAKSGPVLTLEEAEQIRRRRREAGRQAFQSAFADSGSEGDDGSGPEGNE